MDFPGYFAGASLKREFGCGVPGSADEDFPGYFAGASLKRRFR